MTSLAAAVDAVDRGELVVYPTETVYGLGADARVPAAIKQVFAVKGRDRSNPVSMGVADVATAAEYVQIDDRERAFMDRFLPGPVTVVCERTTAVPPELVGGRDRVGIRIPAHDTALALLERAGPITATSANESGTGSVCHPDDLSDRIRSSVAAVIDDGETPGTESTVVDVRAGEIHRRGANADAVERWLERH